ncbi:hypothetical protein VP01_2704g1 [Puccinia sorghi]|uniref:Uncharacterized protein n=1 Tax=Puccinia sorghi TaxID=27349 RepID=A0A0L6V3Q7_9BASI|nr:hypothetical protein VP01_2704g1 [Puccinia sorghi]
MAAIKSTNEERQLYARPLWLDQIHLCDRTWRSKLNLVLPHFAAMFLLIVACYLSETKADMCRKLQNNRFFGAFWQQHQGAPVFPHLSCFECLISWKWRRQSSSRTFLFVCRR